MLEIIYQDTSLICINKPAGLVVHPSSMVQDAKSSAMQELRDQIGQYVFPIHRLDRKTSGLLLFALDKEVQKTMNQIFAEQAILKEYLAIVRGYVEDEGIIDYDLVNDKNKTQAAISHFKCLEKVELDLPTDKFKTSRYSLVKLEPKTGRYHQLRKHMAHIFHPIIGDRPHGCNTQNRLLKEKFGLTEMMLHARHIKFVHPVLEKEISIWANLSPEFTRMMGVLGFEFELRLSH